MSAGPDSAGAAEMGWEAVKENFQPLRAGRKPEALEVDAAVGPTPEQIEAQRRTFYEEIAAYQGDDPIEVWLRFVKWTQDTFPAGGARAQLVPLLERATRELQADGRYADDARYLRLWVQYADCVPQPGDVFAFLEANAIGTRHALLYSAHATFLERRHAFAAADRVYVAGIRRGAAPLDRLREHHAAFQQRMARRIARKEAEKAAGAPDPDAPPPGQPERPSLGVLGGRRPGAGGLGGGTKRKAAARTPARGGAGGSDANALAGGLQVFVDEAFSEGGAAAASAPVLGGYADPDAAGPSAPAGAWTSLGTFEGGRKENVAKATAWAGQRLKQKPAHSAPAAPVLDIPADPEFEAAARAAAAAAAASGAAAAAPALRARADAAGGAEPLGEGLAADPLRLHREAAAPTPAGPPAAAAPAPELAFDAAVLQAAGGEEQCFEEARAAAWAARAAAAAPEPEAMAISPAPVPAGARAEPAAAAPAAPAVPRLSPSPFDQSASGSTVAAPAAAAPGDGPASATLSRRAALASIHAAFGAPAAAAGDVLGAGDVTVSTAAAFSAVNAMFGGALAAEVGALPPSAAAAAADPTVTVSTRAAFDALNEMFGAPAAAAPRPAPPQQAAHPAAAAPGDDFLVREDTVFLGRGGAALPPAGGLDIREDTVFLGGGFGGLENPAAAGGLGIREDTVFLGRGGAGLAPPRPPARGGLQLRAGTASAAPAPAADDATAELQGDTATLPLGSAARGAASSGLTQVLGALNLAPPAATPQPAASSGLTQVLGDLHLGAAAAEPAEEAFEDGKENASRAAAPPPPPAGAPPAAGPLAPMSAARAAALGVEIEAVEEAEAALAAAPAPAGDDDAVDAGAPAPATLVDPFAAGFQQALLDTLEPPVHQWPGVKAVDADEEAAAADAWARARRGRPATLRLGGCAFQLGARLGRGAYGEVWAADEPGGAGAVALKLESPPCAFEFYVASALQGRLPPAAAARFAAPSALLLGPGAGVLVLPRGRCTLQDAVNASLAPPAGGPLGEAAAAHFAAELLEAVGALRAARVVHCDLKPDNLLVAPPCAAHARPRLLVIDFGVSVDLELLPPGALLAGDARTSGFRCVEMREGRPWLWQADAYAAACTVHCLLFGAYMEVERVVAPCGAARLRLKAPLKRHWARDMWAAVFDVLLNEAGPADAPPAARLLPALRTFLAEPGVQRKLDAELARLAKLMNW